MITLKQINDTNLIRRCTVYKMSFGLRKEELIISISMDQIPLPFPKTIPDYCLMSERTCNIMRRSK